MQILTAWTDGSLPYADAIRQLETLKVSALEDGRAQDAAYIESRRGVIEGYRGNYPASISHFEQARDLFLRAGNRLQVLMCNLNIGETYRLKGQYNRARQYFRMGYESAVDQGYREMQVLARANEGQMLLTQGHIDMAEAMLLEAYTLSEQPFEVIEEGQSPQMVRRSWLDQRIDILQALAQIYLERGDPEQAWRFAREAHSVAGEIGSSLALGFATRAVAQAITLLGRPPEAPFAADPDAYFTQAIMAFKDINAEGEIARTLYLQGRSLARRGRATMASRKLHQAITMFSKLGMVDDAARATEEQLKLL